MRIDGSGIAISVSLANHLKAVRTLIGVQRSSVDVVLTVLYYALCYSHCPKMISSRCPGLHVPHQPPPECTGNHPEPVIRLMHLTQEEVMPICEAGLVSPHFPYDRMLSCTQDTFRLGIGQTSDCTPSSVMSSGSVRSYLW